MVPEFEKNFWVTEYHAEDVRHGRNHPDKFPQFPVSFLRKFTAGTRKAWQIVRKGFGIIRVADIVDGYYTNYRDYLSWYKALKEESYYHIEMVDIQDWVKGNVPYALLEPLKDFMANDNPKFIASSWEKVSEKMYDKRTLQRALEKVCLNILGRPLETTVLFSYEKVAYWISDIEVLSALPGKGKVALFKDKPTYDLFLRRLSEVHIGAATRPELLLVSC